MIVDEFHAESFEELFTGVKRIHWKDYLLKNSFIHVNGKSAKSKLFSVSDCQSIAKKAIIESLKQGYGTSYFPENGKPVIIEIGILRDEVTVLSTAAEQGFLAGAIAPTTYLRRFPRHSALQ